MSKGNKRAWKLQDLQAHEGAINCLSIGHRSGKVMATGGDDKKVNLWALGKSFCIMSLKGHTSAVDSVRFNASEDSVVAGSQSGAVKIWNLEASKILRTLSGHKSNVKALDFHPFGEIIATGSSDTNIKLWDYRRKGCIFTYKGHTGGVNCLRFSPDGKWIASAGDDGCSRLWDMATGKQIGDFKHSSGVVTSLAFHPVDFLMTTAGSDRTVKFWDLDTFELISSSEPEASAIRNVIIHPEGGAAYASCQDYLKVYGWEPATCYDSVNVGWGKPADIVVYQNQLIGASIQHNNVQIHMAELSKLNHSAGDSNGQHSNPFTLNPSRRRSFITKCNNNNKQVDGGNDTDKHTNKHTDKHTDKEQFIEDDYKNIFHPKNELPRDFDKRPSLPLDDLKAPRASPTPSLDNKNNHRSHSQQSKQAAKSKPASSKQPPRASFDANKRQQPPLHQRGSPRSKTTTCNFKATTSTAMTSTPTSIGNFDSTIRAPDFPSVKQLNQVLPPTQPFDPFSSHPPPPLPPHLLFNAPFDVATNHHPFFNNDHLSPSDQADELSDDQSISCISGGHQAILNVLSNRKRNLQVFKTLWLAGNIKMSLDSALGMNDQSVLHDVTNLLLQTPHKWSLDMCAGILPVLSSLIRSPYETYTTTALEAVKFLLRTFSSLIKDTLSNALSIGVDISKEERHNKCKLSYQLLKELEIHMDARFASTVMSAAQESHLREIRLLLTQMDA